MNPKPITINDEFWLGLSADVVNNSLTRINTAASTLNQLNLWTLALYTGAGILSVSVNKSLYWLVWVLPIPYLLLACSSYLIVSIQIPFTIKIDPRVPDEIKQAYVETYLEKQKRLDRARILVFITSIITAFIIFFSFALNKIKESDEKEAKAAEKENYFDSRLYQKNDKHDAVTVTGHLPGNISIDVTITSLSIINKHIEQKTLINGVFINGKNGNFILDYNVNKPTTANKYIIFLKWNEGKYTKSMSMTKDIVDK